MRQRLIPPLFPGEWAEISSPETHPLGTLAELDLGVGALRVLLGPVNRFGAVYFMLTSREQGEPLLMGLYHQGPFPAHHWIEVAHFAPTPAMQQAPEITRAPEVRQLFQALADLLPPGGHLMVEYESPAWRTTERSLALDIPPVATPLGYLLFIVGCGTSFKDWYISEGWTEGPRKLQGFKALYDADAEEKGHRMASEIVAFLESPANPSPLEVAAWGCAREVLQALPVRDPDLAARVRRVLSA